MAIEYVTLILNSQDASGAATSGGAAMIAPTTELTDPGDHVLVTQEPVRVWLAADGDTPPAIRLIPTDSGQVSQNGSGWAYTISFTGMAPTPPRTRTVPLLLANGTTQYLSDLPDVVPVTQYQDYVAAPAGANPAAGQVLTATGNGKAVAFAAPSPGAVASVNGKTGPVVLAASDVGADPAGTASDEITALGLGSASRQAASAFSPQGAAGAEWLATDNGMACDDSTDDTGALNALIATVLTAGGGTIKVPSLALVRGQVAIPATVSGSQSRQAPLRITGTLASRPGEGMTGVAYQTGGLDLRYAGRTDTGCGTVLGSCIVTDPSAQSGDYGQIVTCPGVLPDRTYVMAVRPGTGYTLSSGARATSASASLTVGGGKIQSLGIGTLKLDHLLLCDQGTSGQPFILTTGTTLHMHDCAVLGNAAKYGSACDQDVLVCGGPGQGAALTSALASGTSYTSLAVTPLPVAILAGGDLTVSNGTASQKVTCQAAAKGATSIAVTSFTAAASYPVSSALLLLDEQAQADSAAWSVPAAPWQGYGTHLHDNFFDRIRRICLGGFVSDIYLDSNVWWQACGSNLAAVPSALTSALTAGTAYTSLAVSALSAPVIAGDVIQAGVSSPTSTIPSYSVAATATAPAATGATSISVASFTPPVTFPAGTVVFNVSAGIGAALESFGTGGSVNVINATGNRFEFSSGYSYAIRCGPLTCQSTISGNNIQDGSPANIAGYRFSSTAAFNTLVPGLIAPAGLPTADDQSGGTQAIVSARQSQPAWFGQGVAAAGATSRWTGGAGPAIVQSDGGQWQETAGGGTWSVHYTPVSGSASIPLTVSPGVWFALAAAGHEVVNYSGDMALLSAPGNKTSLGDYASTSGVYVHNGSLVAGAGGLAAGATTGFTYLPTVTSAPTGTPATETGTTPAVWNSATGQVLGWNGSAWVSPPANRLIGLQPSGDATGVTDLANISGLLALAGVATLGAGNFRILGTMAGATGMVIEGAGDAETIITQLSTTADTIAGTNLKSFVMRNLRLQGPGSGSGTGNGINLQQTSASVTTYVDLQNVRVRGFPGDGIKIDNPIVSRLSRCIVDTCGGNAFNINGGVSGTVGTSVTMDCTYAIACGKAGYQFTNIHYATLNSPASDSCGAGYIFTNCQNMVMSAPGCETTVNNGGSYTGQAYEINGGRDILLLSPFSNANCSIAWWITGSAQRVKLTAPYETSPAGTATASIQVDAGCYVTVEQPDVTTATLYNGTVVALGVRKPGDVADRLYIDPNGVLRGGGGAASTDAYLQRVTGPLWQSNVGWQTAGSASANIADESSVSGDTFQRFARDLTGKEQRGPGNAAADANWYRSAVGTMRTDQNISIGGQLLGSALVPTSTIKTAAYTAAPGDFVLCDTATTGAFTVTLPAAPADKTIAGAKLVRQASSRAVTIAAGGSDAFNVAGGSVALTLTYLLQGMILQYSAAAALWYLIADDVPLSGTDTRYLGIAAGASGDLSGNYPAPVVAKIQGTAISAPPGGTTQFLAGNGTWQTPAGSGSGTVTSVTAGDTSIVVGGSGAEPTIETATLDVIATDHPPVANWSNNSKKITSIANGTAASDAAAFGQIPAYEGQLSSALILGTDATSTSTGLVSVTGLGLALVSGASYQAEWYLYWQSSLTTVSFGTAVTGPAASPLIIDTECWSSTASGNTSRIVDTAYSTARTKTPAVASTTYVAHVSVLLTTTAAGTIYPQFTASSGGGTATIKAGSWGIARRIV